MEEKVSGLEFGVWGSLFRVWGLGLVLFVLFVRRVLLVLFVSGLGLEV